MDKDCDDDNGDREDNDEDLIDQICRIYDADVKGHCNQGRGIKCTRYETYLCAASKVR